MVDRAPVAPSRSSTSHARRPLRSAIRDLRGHYPVWSVKSIAWLVLLTALVAGAAAFLSGDRSLIVELEITLGIVAGALFALMAIGLFRGVQLKEEDPPPLELNAFNNTREVLSDAGTNLPDMDCPLDAFDGGDEGCLAAIVGFLLSAIVLIVLLGALWLLVEVGAILLLVLLGGVYWVLHLALRQVFAHVATCRGRLMPSLGYASLYTILYTGWLFALLFLAGALIERSA